MRLAKPNGTSWDPFGVPAAFAATLIWVGQAGDSSAMDLDLCLILGAGWPFHNGGIVPLLDREGYTEKLLGRRLLPPGAASVAPAP